MSLTFIFFRVKVPCTKRVVEISESDSAKDRSASFYALYLWVFFSVRALDASLVNGMYNVQQVRADLPSATLQA